MIGASIGFAIYPSHNVSEVNFMIISMIMGAIGAWIPDADLRVKHRVTLHNIFMCLLITIVIYILFINILGKLAIQIPSINPLVLVIPFFLGYMSHLLTDLLTIYGVAILWPFSSNRVSLSKFKSDSFILNAIGVLIAISIFSSKLYVLINPSISEEVNKLLRMFLKFLHSSNP